MGLKTFKKFALALLAISQLSPALVRLVSADFEVQPRPFLEMEDTPERRAAWVYSGRSAALRWMDDAIRTLGRFDGEQQKAFNRIRRGVKLGEAIDRLTSMREKLDAAGLVFKDSPDDPIADLDEFCKENPRTIAFVWRTRPGSINFCENAMPIRGGLGSFQILLEAIIHEPAHQVGIHSETAAEKLAITALAASKNDYHLSSYSEENPDLFRIWKDIYQVVHPEPILRKGFFKKISVSVLDPTGLIQLLKPQADPDPAKRTYVTFRDLKERAEPEIPSAFAGDYRFYLESSGRISLGDLSIEEITKLLERKDRPLDFEINERSEDGCYENLFFDGKVALRINFYANNLEDLATLNRIFSPILGFSASQ